MSTSSISLHDVRLIHLAAQGLLKAPSPSATKEDVLAAIRRMALLQIDTIHVVARSPYFVLFSRLGEYDPAWLDEQLVDGQIFEQWAHAASFLPVEDYPLIRRLILEGMRDSYFSGWIEENIQAVEEVREAISRNGPMKSADFDSEKGQGGWWNWKLEKGAMEYMFSRGELTVIRRENFQRVYDLTSRAIPGWDDRFVPSLDDVYRKLIYKSVRALGVARPAWVADYYRLPKKQVASYIPTMIAAGELIQVNVDGWTEPALTVPEHTDLIHAAINNELNAEYTSLLSPFDPVVWDRLRASQLFNFDFVIQAYTPAAKRQFGYFPLPLLHNGRLIARVDAKANRQQRCFEVKGFFPETGMELSDKVAVPVAAALLRCARWHKTPDIRLADTIPDTIRSLLLKAL